MWKIATTDTFDAWLSEQDDKHRASILAAMIVLRHKGPMLPRPWADTVYASCYPNMKELRVQSGGIPFRVFFAFDPHRTGILLCAGSKSGHDKRFYEVMLPIADKEYSLHLKALANKEKYDGQNT